MTVLSLPVDAAVGSMTTILGIPLPLPASDWQNIQATRGFSLLSIFLGTAAASLGVLSIFKVRRLSSKGTVLDVTFTVGPCVVRRCSEKSAVIPIAVE